MPPMLLLFKIGGVAPSLQGIRPGAGGCRLAFTLRPAPQTYPGGFPMKRLALAALLASLSATALADTVGTYLLSSEGKSQTMTVS